IIWGGSLILSSGFSTNTGARYDPRSNTWTPVTTVGAPSARGWHSAVWTGREMIVWGGAAYAGGPNTLFSNGGRYDPATDTWSPLSATGVPSARYMHSAIWTGDRMLVWGGLGSLGMTNTGAAYSPNLDN